MASLRLVAATVPFTTAVLAVKSCESRENFTLRACTILLVRNGRVGCTTARHTMRLREVTRGAISAKSWGRRPAAPQCLGIAGSICWVWGGRIDLHW